MPTDYILIWNEVALEANRVSHTDGSKEQNGPTLSSRALAIVHLAMYDAYAGVTNDPVNFPPYSPSLPPVPPGATVQEAVGGAAYQALTGLFPSQLGYFQSSLSLHGAAGTPGHDFGALVADAILDDRNSDPSASQGNYKAVKGRGKHRVDPDNPNQGYHGPFYGGAKLFASTARHGLLPPPLDTQPYRKALRQVRAKGIKPELMGTLPDTFAVAQRTAGETLIGIFWGYDGAAGLGTPPRLYNQIAQTIARARNNSEGQNAQLFAFINAAMADAGILAWEQKYHHNFWRPVLGIREGDTSLGPVVMGDPEPAADAISKDADPGWLPLGAPSSNSASPAVMTAQATFPFANTQFGKVKNFTPNFPAYPSGHATFGAAALHILRRFYGVTASAPDSLAKAADGTDLFFISEELNDKTQDNNGTVRPVHRRKFKDGVWDMILENGLSRIFLGVHWIFDAYAVDDEGNPDLSQNIGGIPLGLNIANDIFEVNGKAPKKP